MALTSVNRNPDCFEQLRKLKVPLDTEPAITFRPDRRLAIHRERDQALELAAVLDDGLGDGAEWRLSLRQ